MNRRLYERETLENRKQTTENRDYSKQRLQETETPENRKQTKKKKKQRLQETQTPENQGLQETQTPKNRDPSGFSCDLILEEHGKEFLSPR